MATPPRKLAPASRRFSYLVNGAVITARFTAWPPKGVPHYDTIRLTLTRAKAPGAVGTWVVHMRPDEAVAMADVLLVAAWQAIKPGRRRRKS